MDEVGDNPLREEAATLGATLAAERERQGLARADVAHRLHMSPNQVEALELGDYAHLPKGTFLRGFVRNYAKALGLAPEPLLEMLAGTTPPAPAPGIVVPTQNIRFDPLGERLSSPYVKAATLATVAIAIGFAAMYWAMYVRPRPPALALRAGRAPVATQRAPAAPPHEPATTAAPSSPAGAATESQFPPAPMAGAGGVAGSPSMPASTAPTLSTTAPKPSAAASKPSAKTESTKTATTRPAPAKAGAANAAGSNVAGAEGGAPARRLHFRFVGDSWVEVRDANGAVLFQKLNAAGTEAQVSGRPPLQVIVGNAPEVEMTLDGKRFDLDPHTNVAVARFTLE
ncbi:MAG TPA: RodZ domain-containing protein [Usitatibacter sp.]|nr:RodZ domain-containing protein [Usitatibacter sp.]